MVHTLIIEDDFIFTETLMELLEEESCNVVGNSENSDEAFRLIRATNPNLVLLDIDINGDKNGIDIAEYIRKNELPIVIIFITSFQEDDVFEKAKLCKPFAFINKPIDKKAFKRTIALVKHQIEEYKNKKPINSTLQLTEGINSDEFIFIKVGRNIKKIELASICYIEIRDRILTIVLDKEELTTYYTLKKIIEILPENYFFKVSNYCVVNLKKIREVLPDKNTILLGDFEIAISRRNKKLLKQKLQAILSK